MNDKPVIGQKVFYNYGGDAYFGRVFGIYDDCFIITGRWVGKVKISEKTNHSYHEYTLLFKDGIPVMSRRYLFTHWLKGFLRSDRTAQ